MIYSFTNSYTYENKSSLASFLDCLSSPFRQVLGGKHICILSDTVSSTVGKVKRLALAISLIIAFPIGLIASIAYGLKIAVAHLFSEKEEVEKQFEETKDIIDNFYLFFGSGKDEEAVEAIANRKEIENRIDIQESLLTIRARKINEAIQQKFNGAQESSEDGSSAIHSSLCLIMPAEIDRLIQHQQIIFEDRCIKDLFQGPLAPNRNDSIVLTAWKMSIANKLIDIFIKRRLEDAEGCSVQIHCIKQKEVELYRLYNGLICRSFSFDGILFDKLQLQPIEQLIENIRNMSPLCQRMRILFQEVETSYFALTPCSNLAREIQMCRRWITPSSGPKEQTIMRRAREVLDLAAAYFASLAKKNDEESDKMLAGLLQKKKSYDAFAKETVKKLNKDHDVDSMHALVSKKKMLPQIVEGICTTLIIEKIKILNTGVLQGS